MWSGKSWTGLVPQTKHDLAIGDSGVIFSHKSRETMPAQPVDATPSNRLIRQYFPSRIDLYGSTQSEPKQGSVLFESTLAYEISLLDSYKKTSSKCCIDRLSRQGLSEYGPSYWRPRATLSREVLRGVAAVSIDQSDRRKLMMSCCSLGCRLLKWSTTLFASLSRLL